MSPLDTAARILRLVTVLLGATLVAFFLYVVVARIVFPVEAEWMTGATHDGIARVREGKPLYGPPSLEYISFLYPPLYPWVVAAVSTVTSVFLAAKIVSLASTAFIAWAIARLAKASGASRWWILVAVLLHFGAYSFTVFFYDLARVDTFASAIVMLGLVLLYADASTARTAISGAVLGLAFFAKQPGVLVFAAAAIGLLLSGERRRAAIFSGVGLFVFAVLGVALHLTTHGWFWFYCVKLPFAHGLDSRYVSSFFVVDTPHAFLLFAGSVTVLWTAVRSARDRLFACVLLASIASAFLARSHRGGYPNVLLVWTPLACVAVAIAASRAEAFSTGERGSVVHLSFVTAAALQLAAWSYDPHDVAPQARDLGSEAHFRDYVRHLEEDGEVLVAPAGDLTRLRHFHTASLFDVTDGAEPAPADYVGALETRKFVAIFQRDVDDPSCATSSCREIRDTIARHCFVAAHFVYSARRTGGKVGYDGRPRWLLRPRKVPLSTIDEKAHRREIALAVARGWEAGEDVLPLPDDSIETASRRSD